MSGEADLLYESILTRSESWNQSKPNGEQRRWTIIKLVGITNSSEAS